MPGLQTKKINGEEMWKDKKSWWTLRRRERARKERAERIGGEERRGRDEGCDCDVVEKKEEEGENDRTKDGVPGERRERNQDESRLTWTTWLDLNNRSRSAFEI